MPNTVVSMGNPKRPLVLVIDDDPDLRNLLSDYLSMNDFDVLAVQDGQNMKKVMSAHSPDIIVLDLMLPGEDGLTLTRYLKQTHNQPVLMLSARGDDVDRIVGLEVGADDYLAKPFNPRELLARIRALLRRTTQSIPENGMAATTDYRFGIFRLDLAGRRLLRGNEEVHLTSGEFDLLSVFTKRPNRVLSRDQLIELLKGYDRDAFDRSIDIRIARLRHKIENDPSSPIHIRTVRGEGYLFNPAN